MKKKYFTLGSIIIILLIYYYVDRAFLMKKRTLRHNIWEHVDGEKIRGDFIDTRGLIFNGDTMIFDYGNQGKDTLILNYQYLKTMKMTNPKTNNTCKYTKKGAS